MRRVPIPSRLSGVVCLIAGLGLPSAAWAQQAGRQDEESRARAADEAPGAAPAPAAAARLAAPAAPSLRPVTADEARLLADGIARLVDQSSEGLKVTRDPVTGTTSVDLDDRFQNVSLARVAPDGRPAVRCVSSVQEARQFLATPAPAARPAAPARAAAAAARKPAAAARPAQLTTAQPLEEK